LYKWVRRKRRFPWGAEGWTKASRKEKKREMGRKGLREKRDVSTKFNSRSKELGR